MGFYQSPLYFENFEEELRENVFVLNREFSATGKEWEKKIKNCTNSVSIHIRRGDYLHTPSLQGPNMDYYKRAISLMQSLFGTDVSFFIFSDDYEYIKKEFKWLKNAYIVNSDPDFPYEDMFVTPQKPWGHFFVFLKTENGNQAKLGGVFSKKR